MSINKTMTILFVVFAINLAMTAAMPWDQSTRFQLEIPKFQDDELVNMAPMNEAREVQKFEKKPTNIDKKHFIKNKLKENLQKEIDFETDIESTKPVQNLPQMTGKEAVGDEVVGCKLCLYEDHKYHADKYDHGYHDKYDHHHDEDYDDHHSKHGGYHGKHDDYHGKHDDYHGKHGDFHGKHEDFHGKHDDYQGKYDDYQGEGEHDGHKGDHHGEFDGSHGQYGDDKGKDDDYYVPVYIYGRQSGQPNPPMFDQERHLELSSSFNGHSNEDKQEDDVVGCKHDEYGYDKYDHHKKHHIYDHYNHDDYEGHDEYGYRSAEEIEEKPMQERHIAHLGMHHEHQEDEVGCKHDDYGYEDHHKHHHKHDGYGHGSYDHDGYDHGDYDAYEHGYRAVSQPMQMQNPRFEQELLHDKTFEQGKSALDETVGCDYDYGYDKHHHKGKKYGHHHDKYDEYSHGHGNDEYDHGIYGHGAHAGDGYHDADGEYGYIDHGHKDFGYGRSADALASDITDIMSEISKVQSNIREAELSMARNKNKIPNQKDKKEDIVGDWPEILKKPYLGLIPAKKYEQSYGDDYENDYAPKIHLPKFPYKLEIPYKKLEIPYKKLELPYKKLEIPYKKLELPYKLEIPYKKLELPYKKPDSSDYGEDLKHLLHQSASEYDSGAEDHKAPTYESHEPLYGQTAYNNEHQSQVPAQKIQQYGQDSYAEYSIPDSGEFGYPILKGNAPSHGKTPAAPSYTNVY